MITQDEFYKYQGGWEVSMTLNFKDRIQDEYDWQQTDTFLCNCLVIITWMI